MGLAVFAARPLFMTEPTLTEEQIVQYCFNAALNHDIVVSGSLIGAVTFAAESNVQSPLAMVAIGAGALAVHTCGKRIIAHEMNKLPDLTEDVQLPSIARRILEAPLDRLRGAALGAAAVGTTESFIGMAVGMNENLIKHGTVISLAGSVLTALSYAKRNKTGGIRSWRRN